MAVVLLPCLALAAPEECYGQVSKVLDGDTIEVLIQKADPRIQSAVEVIRLADVNSPELDTPPGLLARDFAYAVLLNKRIFLDIDDLSGNGRDASGRLVCVVYLTGSYGQPLPAPSFNRMLVDSGYAIVKDFKDNEFQPARKIEAPQEMGARWTSCCKNPFGAFSGRSRMPLLSSSRRRPGKPLTGCAASEEKRLPAEKGFRPGIWKG